VLLHCSDWATGSTTGAPFLRGTGIFLLFATTFRPDLRPAVSFRIGTGDSFSGAKSAGA
jgi:hypothetical protein